MKAKDDVLNKSSERLYFYALKRDKSTEVDQVKI